MVNPLWKQEWRHGRKQHIDGGSVLYLPDAYGFYVSASWVFNGTINDSERRTLPRFDSLTKDEVWLSLLFALMRSHCLLVVNDDNKTFLLLFGER